jgi:hypothetical protein
VIVLHSIVMVAHHVLTVLHSVVQRAVIASTAVPIVALATVAQLAMTVVLVLAVMALHRQVLRTTVALKSVAASKIVTNALHVMAHRVQHVMTVQNVIINKSF